jgi:hypothetical protein
MNWTRFKPRWLTWMPRTNTPKRIALAREWGSTHKRIVSGPGKKDGLFWRDDRDPSPLGELAAQASAEGYKVTEQAAPYHGYYYRILKGQGSNAPGGALNYVVKGKMIGGFALIA